MRLINKAILGVEKLIQYVAAGNCPSDLNDTCLRVVKSYEEMLSGYRVDPDSLFKMFDSPSDEIVILRNIEFVSICAHHLLPFVGYAHVGYLPGESGKVIGLSKISRIVDAYAKRLQLQERLTSEIAHCLNGGVGAKGVGVVIVAKHQCLACRGAKKPDAEMVTSVMLGHFRNKPEARSEFLALLKI